MIFVQSGLLMKKCEISSKLENKLSNRLFVWTSKLKRFRMLDGNCNSTNHIY